MLSLVLLPVAAVAQTPENKGDDKIQSLKSSLSEAYESTNRNENQKEHHAGGNKTKKTNTISKQREEVPPSSGNDDDSSSQLNPIVVEIFLKIFGAVVGYSFTVRYADYPFAPTAPFRFNASLTDPHVTATNSGWACMDVSLQSAYLLDNLFAVEGRAHLNLTAFHINTVYQSILSPNDSLFVWSVNAGLTFFNFRDFMLNGYMGVFYTDLIDKTLLSYGFQVRIFLSRQVYLDFFSVYARDRSLDPAVKFNMYNLSLNITWRQFALGFGGIHDYFHRTAFTGPMLRLSFWF